MDLNEYMSSIMDWALDMEEELTDEELDDVELTVYAVASQLGWLNQIHFKRD